MALQEKHKHSQAAQQEAEGELALVRTKLKGAEESAATQLHLNSQLQQKLTIAENSLAAATSKEVACEEAQQALSQELKRQQEARGADQTAHAHAAAEVRGTVQ